MSTFIKCFLKDEFGFPLTLTLSPKGRGKVILSPPGRGPR